MYKDFTNFVKNCALNQEIKWQNLNFNVFSKDSLPLL